MEMNKLRVKQRKAADGHIELRERLKKGLNDRAIDKKQRARNKAAINNEPVSYVILDFLLADRSRAEKKIKIKKSNVSQ